MGRARNKQGAIDASGFDGLLGNRRGGTRGSLLVVDPHAADEQMFQAVKTAINAGDFSEATEDLSRYWHQQERYPLLGQLAVALRDGMVTQATIKQGGYGRAVLEELGLPIGTDEMPLPEPLGSKFTEKFEQEMDKRLQRLLGDLSTKPTDELGDVVYRKFFIQYAAAHCHRHADAIQQELGIPDQQWPRMDAELWRVVIETLMNDQTSIHTNRLEREERERNGEDISYFAGEETAEQEHDRVRRAVKNASKVRTRQKQIAEAKARPR